MQKMKVNNVFYATQSYELSRRTVFTKRAKYALGRLVRVEGFVSTKGSLYIKTQIGEDVYEYWKLREASKLDFNDMFITIDTFFQDVVICELTKDISYELLFARRDELEDQMRKRDLWVKEHIKEELS